MKHDSAIPVFTLFGETAHFPDVVHCESFFARAPGHGWQIEAHRHAHMAQLFVITDGHLSGRIDDRATTVRSGEFMFVPAQVVHGFSVEPDTEGQIVSIPANVLQTVAPSAQEMAQALTKPLTETAPAQLLGLTDMLVEVARGTDAFRTQHALGLAQAMLALVAQIAQARGDSPSGQSDPRLDHLEQLVIRHMADGWSTARYAQALSLTTGHLSRLCRAATGLGATAFIDQRIMAEACRLLAFTRLPVSEVGYRLGYDDPSYFSKRFRAARGQAPSDYRQQFNG